MKRFGILLALAVTVATVCFAGGAQEAPAATEAAAEKPVELTVLTGNFKGTDLDNTVVNQMIEEKLNLDLNIISTSFGEAYTNKQNVMIASGDYPDIMNVLDNPTEAKYVEGGILEPINAHWDEYPNIKQVREQDIWDLMTHPDGNVYLIPTTLNSQFGPIYGQEVIMYRGDWLEQFGVELPTTLDEYMNVANMVSHDDPDGNGEDDTYAIVGLLGNLKQFEHIFAVYGALPNYYYLEDDRIVAGSIQPQAKEALIHLNQMYEDGLIDPEFVTDNKSRYLDKLYNGIVGASVFWAGASDPANDVYEHFTDRNPDGWYEIGKPLAAISDDSLPFVGMGSRRGWLRTGVVSKSEKKDAAFMLLDYISSKEGSVLVHYGIEGEHYVVEDGVYRRIVNEAGQAEAGVNLHNVPIIRTAYVMHYQVDYQKALVELSGQMVGNITDKYLMPEVGEYEMVLKDFTQEQFDKMIIGAMPIESNFESFVDEWKARGGAELLSALNAARNSE